MNIGFVCNVITIVLFLIMGGIAFVDGRKDKQTMRLTPWPPNSSWLIWFALMVSLISNAISAWQGR